MAADVVQILLGLLVVVGAIFGTAWLFRRTGAVTGGQRGELRLLGGIAVGSRERVVLLECRGQALLVGVAQGQVQALHAFEPGSAPVVDEAVEAEVPANPSFGRAMAAVLRGEGTR